MTIDDELAELRRAWAELGSKVAAALALDRLVAWIARTCERRG